MMFTGKRLNEQDDSLLAMYVFNMLSFVFCVSRGKDGRTWSHRPEARPANDVCRQGLTGPQCGPCIRLTQARL